MNIQKLTLGYVQTNTYFIDSPSGLIVIDPCIATPQDYDAVCEMVQDKPIVAILLTHGHFDHIAGVDHLMQENTILYISDKDKDYLVNPQLNGSWMIQENLMINATPTIINSNKIEVDSFTFKVIETPGHTHGSVAFLLDKHCFIGDFIMDGSIGRTDLEGGSSLEMRNSLITFKKRFENKKISLYPGHGSISQFSDELKHNPYLSKR
ncbi:hypothetical protein AOC36_05010 [Erysipelothrix larvae]|uniref:Metallo-beta-lactamase domain-containing protein n=1 Tax=Erysipelothrix larvae TaxID=1514105 RepID=A0A0X8GZL5_9FIRM|nr:MBL fold metallo-hydrolase [Erysipelothrix larvae]AMC93357.1 hypothetical protein AOC36_05010 [Erysipelothrix larvae]